MVNSRTKGASFEREVAKLLLLELGITLSVTCANTKRQTTAT
jgi:hypothetical protein